MNVHLLSGTGFWKVPVNTEICPESLGGCCVPNDDWGLDVTFSVE
jgi:hypothetical protein